MIFYFVLTMTIINMVKSQWEPGNYVESRSIVKDKNIPVIRHGPFERDRGIISDRSYDIGFVLGYEYGGRLGNGIKTGIKDSVGGSGGGGREGNKKGKKSKKDTKTSTEVTEVTKVTEDE
ncbi:uncharacterized protein LOC128959970 [Oppia nitens]|uniref:uncharacterized protein LOC128959970 n=1 Tax=Oppia nitens TaxID=1686743 RepID=UPI0023DB872A|nr:uncharacterized protein LOC128959970 [Oppia nitens]